jgi:hypothetical protein
MFHHWNGSSTPNIQDLHTELTRLEHHKLLTITDSAKQFLQRVSLEDFTMTTLNVQSFGSHFPDVSTDPMLASKDILALTDNDEIVPEGYTCITQFKRQDDRAGGVAIYEKSNATAMATPHLLIKLDKQNMAKTSFKLPASETCGDVCAAE